ncbi:MAG: IMP dehydrogenase [bacterium]
MDGVSIKELFEITSGESLAYNDLILLPGYTDFGIEDINLNTKLSRNIDLKIPIVSAPMDTVTGDELARWMALLGGIGFIHYNNSIEKQQEMVKKVKRYENGFISNVETRNPNDLIDSLRDCQYSNIPITEDGLSNGKLVGMLTKYDYSLAKHGDIPIKERMKGLDKITFVSIDEISSNNKLNIKKANDLLLENSVLALPIIDNKGDLKYLVTRKDIETNVEYPLATKDENKKLRVGAAVGTREADKERADALAKAGVDTIKIDCAHGHTSYQIEMINYIKKTYPGVDIASGNVVTSNAAEDLIKAGADAICVGMGIGSMCITQEVTAAGRAQASAIYHVSQAAKKYNIPVIADGGISQSGHILKAWVLGAHSCMVGNMLAGTDESLGEWIVTKTGEKLKRYRGMGSHEAMKAGSDKRYSVNVNKEKAAEGVIASVLSKGHVYDLLPSICAGVKQGMLKIGCKNLIEIRDKSVKGEIRVEKRTFSAQREGDVHDLILGN